MTELMVVGGARRPADPAHERLRILLRAADLAEAERLLAWAAAANVLKSRWLGTAATALPVALLGALIWGAALGQWLPAGAILVLEIALLARRSGIF